MIADPRQRGELGVDGQQVHEGAEGGGRQGEVAAIEVERLHAPLDEREVGRRVLGAEDLEHRRRRVDADAGEAGAGDRQEHAAGAAAELEDGAAALGRERCVELAIAGVVADVGVLGVVGRRDQALVVEGHHTSLRIRR